MWRDVEEVAAAVVREYLSRKGLRKTIACMDEELPRTNVSINNRSELRRVLRLEGLYKKNKCEEQPLKSMLELMTKERLMKRSADVKRRPSETDQSPAWTAAQPHPTADGDRKQEVRLSETSSQLTCSPPSPPAIDANLNPVSSARTGPAGGGQASRGSRMRRGIMAGPISASTQENPRRCPARKTPPSPSVLSPNLDEDSTGTTQRGRSYSVDPSHGRSDERENGTSTAAAAARRDARPPAGLVLEDVDDEEIPSGPTAIARGPAWNKRHLDQETAAALKMMIFGSSTACFSAEWRCQSFTFSDRPALRYGIVQKKGGPCGVLAAVQAAVLQNLLFKGSSGDGDGDGARTVPLTDGARTAPLTDGAGTAPLTDGARAALLTDGARTAPLTDGARTACLADAVAGILWRAADRQNVTVAINSGRSHFTSTACCRADCVLETIDCVDVQRFDDLKLLVEQNIHQFESGPLGCVLLIVSALLSRTIPKVRGDMDVPTAALIGAHGYCTQELVNLLMCGRAVSNVFDGDMKLDSGNGNVVLLKGVGERGDVGLLSLFEHYNVCKVGSNLKNPRFPVWVVCSESHFSVLFSPCGALTRGRRTPRRFDLYYYDGLANQQEPIRLTVYPDSPVKTPDATDPNSDLVPPLELCIRTRWTDAAVSWNGSEPIL